MTLRERCTPIQLQAHAILDMVRAGVPMPADRVNWALAALGESL